MKITADSIFIQGQGHRVCQDYAYHGKVLWNDFVTKKVTEYTYAVISDGCSSSANTDVGARLLCHSFIDILRREGLNNGTADLALFLADIARKNIGMGPECLDVTLFAIVTDGNSVHILRYGDGFFVDNKHREEIKYTSGAPFYLNYRSDPKRLERYFQEFGNTAFKTVWSYKSDHAFTSSIDLEKPIPDYTAEINPGMNIYVVMSDGFASFSLNGTSVDSLHIAEKALAFKTYNGEFVTRRMMRFLQDTQKEGLKHFDDLSMAAISIEV